MQKKVCHAYKREQAEQRRLQFGQQGKGLLGLEYPLFDDQHPHQDECPYCDGVKDGKHASQGQAESEDTIQLQMEEYGQEQICQGRIGDPEQGVFLCFFSTSSRILVCKYNR